MRPATATAVVVGDLTGVHLDTVLADTLGGWTGDAAEPVAMPPVAADDTGRVVIVDRPGAVQTQLLIGRTGPDRHDRVWPALVLGTYCLGGTLTSRLDRVLREEKGYTYGIRAFQRVLRSPAPLASERATGVSLLAISGSVDTASTGPALNDLWTVLRTLAAEGLTETERDTAVQNLVGVAPLQYERAASVARTLADQVEQHLPDDYQAHLYARLAETGTAEATAGDCGVPGEPPRHDPGRRRISDQGPGERPWNRRHRGSHRLTLRNPPARRRPVYHPQPPRHARWASGARSVSSESNRSPLR